jgi:hypothetical protein
MAAKIEAVKVASPQRDVDTRRPQLRACEVRHPRRGRMGGASPVRPLSRAAFAATGWTAVMRRLPSTQGVTWPSSVRARPRSCSTR